MGIIGGIEREILLALLSDVLLVLPSGLVRLQDGCDYDRLKFPEGSLSFDETSENTPSGVIYAAALTGQLSPVNIKNSGILSRYTNKPFICIFKLKSGGAKILGDTAISCKLVYNAEVSDDFSTSAYNVEITCRNSHESYFVDNF